MGSEWVVWHADWWLRMPDFPENRNPTGKSQIPLFAMTTKTKKVKDFYQFPSDGNLIIGSRFNSD
jgi:hypothetical protein